MEYHVGSLSLRQRDRLEADSHCLAKNIPSVPPPSALPARPLGSSLARNNHWVGVALDEYARSLLADDIARLQTQPAALDPHAEAIT